MKKIIKISKFDNFFDNLVLYSFCAYIFVGPFAQTQIYGYNILHQILSYTMKLSFALIILKDFYDFLRGKFCIKEILIYGVLGLLFLYNYRYNHEALPLLILLYIAGYKNIDIDKFIKCTLISMILSIVIIIASDFIIDGKFSYAIQYRYGAERHRYLLGYDWATATQDYFFGITLMLLLYLKKPKIWQYIIMFIITLILFVLTDTKFSATCTVLALILHYIAIYHGSKIIDGILSLFAILSFPLGAIYILIASLLYKYDIPIINFMSDISSSRIALAAKGIKNWGITLFGSKNVSYSFGPDYSYIDSSYMAMLFISGAIVLIVVILFYMYYSYIAYKIKYKAILISLLLIALHSIFDPQLTHLIFHPQILLFSPLFYQYYLKGKIWKA